MLPHRTVPVIEEGLGIFTASQSHMALGSRQVLESVDYGRLPERGGCLCIYGRVTIHAGARCSGGAAALGYLHCDE